MPSIDGVGTPLTPQRGVLFKKCYRQAWPASRGDGESTGAVRGGTPFRSAVLARFGQSMPYAINVEILGIGRRAGLLPPRLVKPPGINAVEAQFVDEL